MAFELTPFVAGDPLDLRYEVKVDGVPTDADPGTVVFRDPTHSYGMYRTDNNTAVIAAGQPWVKTSGQTGKYHYWFEKPSTLGLWFVYWVEYQIDGVVFRERFTQPSNDGLSVPVPPAPELATGYIIARNGQGAIDEGAELHFRLTDPKAYTGTYPRDPFTATSNAEGLVSGTFIRGAVYQGRRGFGRWITFTIPDAESFPLPTFIGEDTEGCEI